MANEWFFKWHFIGRQDGPVGIDDFNGRTIRYGGIAFEGTPRLVYWNTLKRYLRVKIGATFDQLEHDLLSYPPKLAAAAVSDYQSLLDSFIRSIIHMAVEKDRILRGDGMNFPDRDHSSAQELMLFSEVEHRAKSIGALISEREGNRPATRLQRVEMFMREYKETAGILIGAGGAIGALLLAAAKGLISK